MNINVGGWDRFLRIVMGITLIFVALRLFRPTLWLLGLSMLYTGVYRSCPLYRLIGFHTSAVIPGFSVSRTGLFK
ncbi:MAG: DUF2892 domain-containing protein [Magnetococcales bacterium]|nr:DUF2892 domain-containing protein [Magnetococcales bacterium]